MNAARQVCRGTLISSLTIAGDVTRTPDTHVVYLAGEFPCTSDGQPINKSLTRAGKSALATA